MIRKKDDLVNKTVDLQQCPLVPDNGQFRCGSVCFRTRANPASWVPILHPEYQSCILSTNPVSEVQILYLKYESCSKLGSPLRIYREKKYGLGKKLVHDPERLFMWWIKLESGQWLDASLTARPWGRFDQWKLGGNTAKLVFMSRIRSRIHRGSGPGSCKSWHRMQDCPGTTL